MDLFAPLVAFLGLKAHGRDRARIQPLEADRLAGDLAIAILALVDPAQGRLTVTIFADYIPDPAA